VQEEPERYAYRLLERTFADRGHGDSFTLRPRYTHRWYLRLVGRLVCQWSYHHPARAAGSRLRLVQTTAQIWPLQAGMDRTLMRLSMLMADWLSW